LRGDPGEGPELKHPRLHAAIRTEAKSVPQG